MEKEISVLIPVYNVEAYIEKCLRSVFTNTYIDKAEVILVDDCTPDSSMEIASKVIQEYPNIDVKIIKHKENMGIACVRNTCLEAAKGKYIIFVDSDDWCESDYLEKLYSKAVETNSDITTCDFYFYEKNKQMQIIENGEIENSIEYLKQILLLQKWCNIWFFFTKRSFYMEHNLHWEKGINLGEDHYIIQRLLCFNPKLNHISKPLYHYNYTNPMSLSYNMTNSIDFYNKISLVTKSNYAFFKEIDIYPLIQKEADFSLIEPKIKILKLCTVFNYKKNVSFNLDEYKFLKEINLYSNKLLLIIKNIAMKKYFISSSLIFLMQLKRTLKYFKQYLKIKLISTN